MESKYFSKNKKWPLIQNIICFILYATIICHDYDTNVKKNVNVN